MEEKDIIYLYIYIYICHIHICHIHLPPSLVWEERMRKIWAGGVEGGAIGNRGSEGEGCSCGALCLHAKSWARGACHEHLNCRQLLSKKLTFIGRKHPSRNVIFSGQNLAKKMPKMITSYDVLEPLEQVLSASRDVIISGQICGPKLQRVITLGDGCWLPNLLD